MNYLLMSAGLLSLAIGTIHSLLGEFLVFNKLRNRSIVPSHAVPPLQRSHVRILWATWHLASIFGFALGAVLIHFSGDPNGNTFVVQTIAISMGIASALVCFATKAKHPGWIGLSIVAALCFIA